VSAARADDLLCPLCETHGGRILHQAVLFRVVQVDEPTFADYPGYVRVIATRHAREMSDLPKEEADALLAAVLSCERAVRATMQCDKVNLASLGNQTPHVHWHVIPRFFDDAHFPHPVWSTRQRDTQAQVLAERHRRAEAIGESLRLAFL
jgi:diadenosine tetraphosphate (Ap4A) HIT family hydrolase